MLKIYTGEQLLREKIEVVPKLVDPFFPRVGIVGLAGSSDTGKSTILQQLALSLVAGENDFLGFRIHPTHKSVVFVSTEDDPSAIKVRLAKHNNGKYKPNQIAGLRFVFEYEDIYQELDDELTQRKADCVIIDAFADVFGGGDMNQVGSVRSCINKFNVIAQKHQCLFIILHHTGKRTDASAPSKDDLVGSQGFEAKMRTVLLLRKDPHDLFTRHLCIVKGNYLSSSEKQESYVLHFDDSLIFTNTGQRVPLSSLSQRNSSNKPKEWLKRAIDLDLEGKSLRAISAQLLKEGYKSCNKSSVDEELKKHKSGKYGQINSEQELIDFLNSGEDVYED